MKQMLKKLWKDESAQGATEYILMLVVVVALAYTFKGQIMQIVQRKAEDVGNKINDFN